MIAAAGTTAMAAVARAADVSLEVDGNAIPVPAFAWWTLVAAVLGVLMARVLRERRRFLMVTCGATAVSLIPPLAMADGAATKAVLVAAHLLAAVVIIPMLSKGLADAKGGTQGP